ncbi:MAG: hypothetical protein IKV03_02275 [Alphaproteobacteria bacterium]|nr:hypothetical protein [Alphaproteobacteria bacterium]
MIKTNYEITQVDEVLKRQTAENRPDLKGARLERFLAEAANLRRNLALRKKQQRERDEKCMHSK